MATTWTVPGVQHRRRSGEREYRLKRVFDVGLASVVLIVSAPLWVVIAAAIRLYDGGPALFTQSRWGRNRSAIRVYKFRTMVVDAEAKFGAIQATEDDPRVTRVGRVLRATALDELPQILSIWKGDMSWVGPRALPIGEIQTQERSHVPDEAIPGFAERCSVRPGLTGIAQIYAPRDVPRRHKFKYDRIYIRRQSLWTDVRLIGLSFLITFAGRWERRGRKL